MDELSTTQKKLQEIIWQIGDSRTLFQALHAEVKQAIANQTDYKTRAEHAEALIIDLRVIIDQLRADVAKARGAA